jgi:hypothetical protein
MRKGIFMARDVRVVESSGYSGGGFLRPDVEVINGRGPYTRRRWRGGEPLVLILILALVAIWMYQKTGGELFGRQIGGWISTPSKVPPVEIETAPVAPPVAPVAPVPVEEPPPVTVEPRPALTAEQQSDILGHSRVGVERLNLRDQPGLDRRVIAVLPRHWEVAILRQAHVTPNGDVWIEVMAETDGGWRMGWVLRRYLESCINCPTP